MMIAPASRSLRVMKASLGGIEPVERNEPPVVGMSPVSMMSLSATGMPYSGLRAHAGMPRRVELARLVQRRGFTWMNALTAGPDVFVRRDARQVHLDELLGRDEPRLQRTLHVRNRRFDEPELCSAGEVVAAPAGAGRRS